MKRGFGLFLVLALVLLGGESWGGTLKPQMPRGPYSLDIKASAEALVQKLEKRFTPPPAKVVLVRKGEVLLLDEPASGVDPAKVGDMLKLVKEAAGMGKAICIVEHNLDIVRELADVAYFMDQGEEVAKGTPEELMKDRRLAEIYFGV